MHAGPESSDFSLSPSFNSYSNYNLAEIAARVVDEFRVDINSEEYYDEYCIENKEKSTIEKFEEEADSNSVEKEDENDGADEEFEFAFVAKESEFPSPIAADEIFYNGQIRPVFPIFNRDLLLGNVKFENENSAASEAPKIRVPLRKLFSEERETTSSSSSSDMDELDNLPPGTYCVWKPKAAAEAGTQCKKSSSAGSSKRWKFRDLLYRSSSDGRKDTFVLFTPTNRGRKQENQKIEEPRETPAVPPCITEGERRRSGDDDMAGFFAVVNGLSRNFKPF